MSVSIVIGKRHLLAGLSVLALTALIGVMLVVPAVSDATTYLTRSASCAGVNFYPDDSPAQYFTSITERFNISGAAEGFRCNAALPNGAIVTKVQFTVEYAATCYLSRVGLQALDNFTHMAGPLTSVSVGLARLTSTSITDATIDDANNAYVLECSLPNDSAIDGADVIYKITAGKG